MIHEQIDPMIVEEDEVVSRMDEFESAEEFAEFARETVRRLARRLGLPPLLLEPREDEP